MRFQNKAKPIKFCLPMGDKECRSVEDVKNNFAFDSLYDSFKNGTLQKWLKQIGESSLLNRIDDFSSQDLLTKKVRLYNLFSPEPLSSDEVNEDNVLQLMTKGCINIGDLSETPEIKKSIIENANYENINSWCESDLELLKYVYSKMSYGNLNAQNCRTLINNKIITNEDLAMKIATKKNLNDILERLNKSTVRIGNVVIEMILVKGYQAGDFYIGKYPVTQAQWQAVMGNNPSNFKGEDNPVENVSWNDCLDFIKQLNSKTGRKFWLPRESQWEYAARGGNQSNNYKYSGSNRLDEVGWYDTNSKSMTHPVGRKYPNELGIYDMSGNVWEWCEDRDGPTHSIRGGSFSSIVNYCTVSYCENEFPGTWNPRIGFRLVMDA